jgi:hypothetical protein
MGSIHPASGNKKVGRRGVPRLPPASVGTHRLDECAYRRRKQTYAPAKTDLVRLSNRMEPTRTRRRTSRGRRRVSADYERCRGGDVLGAFVNGVA